jgi:ribulose-phosphate 3-epimerase
MPPHPTPHDRAGRLAAFRAAAAPVVTPSLLGCDFARVADELATLERAGAHGVHLDVMDGHFVSNLTYGPPPIESWRKVTDLFFDAHLMIDDPARYLDEFLAAGCDAVAVHIEVLPDPRPVLRRIRDAGASATLTLNPPTPLAAIEPFLDDADAVLVMSVIPGRGGQAFRREALDRVRALRAARPNLPISVDGGIKASNAAEVVAAGATQLVVGSAIFRPGADRVAALAELEAAARRGMDIEARGDTPG